MMPLPLLVLLLVWIVGWLGTSYEIVRFIKNCPDEDDPGFLLWDLEDQLPTFVALMLITWPVVAVRVTLTVWRLRQSNRPSGS